MVLAEVACAEQRVGLVHELPELHDLIVRDRKRLGAVRRHVQVLARRGSRREIHAPEVDAREHRRVHERCERGGRELDEPCVLTLRRKRGAVLPAGGQPDARQEVDVVRVASGRIEQHLIPGEQHQLLGARGRRREPFRRSRRDEIEAHIERRGALRHIACDRVHVDRVARPAQRLAARGEMQARDVGERSGRAVLARDPLGVDQRERPGLDRNRELRVEDLARRLAGVHGERDRAARIACARGRGERERGSASCERGNRERARDAESGRHRGPLLSAVRARRGTSQAGNSSTRVRTVPSPTGPRTSTSPPAA